MKIAIVSFQYIPEKSGGVANVVTGLIRLLESIYGQAPEVISISNSRYDDYSRSIFKPYSWGNRIHQIESNDFQTIHRVGTIGSELEIFRYMRRPILGKILKNFDAVFVVTGHLQFCNVLPRLDIPIYVQVATRLKWERASQYSQMPVMKKLTLIAQIPFLSILERKVIRRDFTFMPENEVMKKWFIDKKVKKISKWHPPILGIPSKIIGLQKSDGSFISVGRLNESRKGWERLFLAYDLANSLDSTIPSLHIVGRGELPKASLQILNSIASSSKIFVHENLDDAKRNELLDSASVFLQTSYEEGLGLAAIEALNFGLPLICSQTFGSLEYVEDCKNGRIIPQNEDFISAFAQAITEVKRWNYSKFSEASKRIFEEKFAEEKSRKRLQFILNGISEL